MKTLIFVQLNFRIFVMMRRCWHALNLHAQSCKRIENIVLQIVISLGHSNSATVERKWKSRWSQRCCFTRREMDVPWQCLYFLICFLVLFSLYVINILNLVLLHSVGLENMCNCLCMIVDLFLVQNVQNVQHYSVLYHRCTQTFFSTHHLLIEKYLFQ